MANNCIQDDRANHKGMSWCGKRIIGWHFLDSAHAVSTGRIGDNPALCPNCREAVIAALRNCRVEAPSPLTSSRKVW